MRLSRFLLLGTGVLALGACSDDAVTTVSTDPQAYVRWVHASPNMGGLDLLFQDRVENLPTFFAVPFRGNTGYYRGVNAGSRTVRVFTTVPQSPPSPTPPQIVVDNQVLDLQPERYYTLVQVGRAGGTGDDAPRVLVIEDALPAQPPAGVAVRVVNLARSQGNVDVHVLSGGSTGLASPLVSAPGLAFGTASGYLNLAALPSDTTVASFYRFAVTPAGTATVVANVVPRLAGRRAIPPPASNPTARPIDAEAGVQVAGSALTAFVMPAAEAGSPAATATNQTPTVVLVADKNPPRISQ